MKALAYILSALAVGVALSAQAIDFDLVQVESLDLAEGPLGQGVRPEPNMQFIIDDSQSMSSTIVTPDVTTEGKAVLSGLPQATTYSEFFPPVHFNATFNHLLDSTLLLPTQEFVEQWNEVSVSGTALRTANAGVNFTSEEVKGVWRYRNSDYNRLYYNPNRSYSPWPGYSDASPTAALLDPSQPAITIDLTAEFDFVARNVPADVGTAFLTMEHKDYGCLAGFNIAGICLGVDFDGRVRPAYYYTWNDANSDGVVDIAEKGSKITITNSAELQNFANWFSYHRNKSLLARGAAIDIVDGRNDFRAALTTVHNNPDSHFEMASMEALASSGSNKANFIAAVAGAKSQSAASPLRSALTRAGNYLACNNAGYYETYYDAALGSPIFNASQNAYSNTVCPSLAAADGGSCQENHTLLFTDGFNTADAAVVSYQGEPNQTGLVNGQAVKNYNDPLSNGSSNDVDGDGFADTVADVASFYYENDINASLDGEQTVRTQVVLTSVLEDLDTSGGVPNPDPSSAGFTAKNSLLDLQHATESSGGKLVDGVVTSTVGDRFVHLFRPSLNRNGAGVATSASGNVLGAGRYIFQGYFDNEDLSGDVVAFPLNIDNSVGAQAWSAKSKLATKIGSSGQNHSNRFVLTFNPSKTASQREGMELTYANLQNTGFFLGFPIPNVGQLDDITSDLLLDLLSAIGGITEDDLNEALEFEPALDQATINYLRGDQSNELQNGGIFRDRSTALGPIYHSNIAYVPEIPAFDYPDGAFGASGANSYATHRSTYISGSKSRPAMIYVGGNDGMLHGFDAATGEEKLAYVPSALWSKLRGYTSPDLAVSAYVDGEISIVDAYGDFPLCGSGSCWRTILVGSLRAGGRSIYALDVTEPSLFNSSNAADLVLWEFSAIPNSVTAGLDTYLKNAVCAALSVSCSGTIGSLLATAISGLTTALFPANAYGDRDLGLTYGKPKIIYLPNGQWAAVFGNGYNSVGDDPGVVEEVGDLADLLGGGAGDAVIYLVRLDGADSVRGTKIAKFDTGMGLYFDPDLLVSLLGSVSLADLTGPGGITNSLETALGEPPKALANGMSEVTAVDLDPPLSTAVADYGKVDVLYAGDLQGNLWRLDISGSTPSAWGYSYGARSYSAASQPLPMYSPTVDAQRWQPIINAPEVIRHPTDADGEIVLIGTGKFIEVGDASDTSGAIQSLYALWDRKANNNLESSAPSDFQRSKLLKREIQQETNITAGGGSETVRITSDSQVIDWDDSAANYHRGWYMDLVVGAGTGDGERTFAGPQTRNGRVLLTTAVPGGQLCSSNASGWLYSLVAADGGRPFTPPIDFDGDGIFSSGDRVTISGESVSPSAASLGEGTAKVPSLVVDAQGRELQISPNDEGTLEITTGNAAGFEHSRSTWKVCLP